MTAIAEVARDPRWLAHRYDPTRDEVRLLHLTREDQRRATFLTEEYLPTPPREEAWPRAQLMAAAAAPAPIHFIFHSAFCCSTLLARAFDLPGIAMGLKEPLVLQDIVGWRRRGGEPARVAMVLDHMLHLLAKPFAAGETLVVKPSNILNGLADAVLKLRPQARALLLHAPLRTYLASVARKGMWGRWWARGLLVDLVKEGLVEPLGFDLEQLLGQTDLQVAATEWLAQHRVFLGLARQFGERVRTLDSATLTARPRDTVAALARLYGLAIDGAALDAIVAGPAFTSHSKWGTSFDAAARDDETRAATAQHADEIDKVAVWTEAVAAHAGVPLALPSPLLG